MPQKADALKCLKIPNSTELQQRGLCLVSFLLPLADSRSLGYLPHVLQGEQKAFIR